MTTDAMALLLIMCLSLLLIQPGHGWLGNHLGLNCPAHHRFPIRSMKLPRLAYHFHFQPVKIRKSSKLRLSDTETSRSNATKQRQPRPLIPFQSKDELLYLIQCMSIPGDSNDPDYDADMFSSRMKLLESVTFEELQRHLRDVLKVNYIASSSKESMLVQYLLYMYDPTVEYTDM